MGLDPLLNELDNSYYSRFQDWYEVASVRGGSRRVPNSNETNCLFFSPELVPAANHPLIREQGDSAVYTILAQHLFTHLDFTDTLEIEAVAPASSLIARCSTKFRLPSGMRRDARKIATDEMYHALFASDLLEELSLAAGVVPLPPKRPAFLQYLDRRFATQTRDQQQLTMLFFVAVSETLITGTLSRVPTDERVAGVVRDVLRDHAEDEARHHGFYAEFIKRAWPQLEPKEKEFLGPLLPEFILAFLRPDQQALVQALSSVGLTRPQVNQVMEECYSPEAVRQGVLAGSRSTMRHFEHYGIFDHPATHDAFARHGLLPSWREGQSVQEERAVA